MDPNIARLIERTRARRVELREGSINSNSSPLPSERERSPLKERNCPSHLRSPVKGSVEIPVSRSLAKAQGEESPSNTIRRLLSRESLENNVQDLITKESPGKGIVSRTVSTKVSSTNPGVGGTTITKTVITEKEERIEKKEIISYKGNQEFLSGMEQSNIGGKKNEGMTREYCNEVVGSPSKKSSQTIETKSPNKRLESPGKRQHSPRKSPYKNIENEFPEKDQLSPMKENDFNAGCKVRLANLANKLKYIDDDEKEVSKEEVKFPKAATKPALRAASPTKHAAVKTGHLRLRTPSPTKVDPMQFISPPKFPSPSVSAHVAIPTSPCKEANSAFRSVLGSKAAAATNFNQTPAGFVTDSRAETKRTYRSVSPPKAAPPIPTNSDSSFLTSLKAQGFQETASKSKLVYDFEKIPESPERTNFADNMFLKNDEASKDTTGRQARDQLSPMRENMVKPVRERSSSPVRNNVFLQRDQASEERGRNHTRKSEQGKNVARAQSPTKPLIRTQSPTKPMNRGHSPTKPMNKTNSPTKPINRVHSPTKPHSQQYVLAPSQQPAPSGPPKPSRTFQTEAARVTDPTSLVSDSRVDTLQTKSISEKRTMFEYVGGGSPVELPDPSSIPLSQRKALFEKVKSVPTPIARFGESVTPAMLERTRAQSASESRTPALAPKVRTQSVADTQGEAWKRKRAESPSLAASPRKETGGKPGWVKEAQVSTPQQPVAGMEDRQRRLFAASNPNWRDNDIAKKVAYEKQADMELLLGRYKHLRKDESALPVQNTENVATVHALQPTPLVSKAWPTSPTLDPEASEKYYPGVNSMKRVKVSPPKDGKLYPQIDFDSDRPESVMSSDTLNDSYESHVTSTSEAPSLGKDIVMTARQGMIEQELTTIPEGNDSMETDEGDGMTDSVLEAALDDEEEDDDYRDEDRPTPPKVARSSSSSSGSDRVGRSESTTSWEFHTPHSSRDRKQQKFRTPMIVHTPPGVDSPRVEVEGEDSLIHTVSFYRAQKPITPVQRIVVEPRIEERMTAAAEESPRATISQRIHRLQEEAASQMPVIQQASRALSLCRSTKEFFGSSEQVEGEKLLLVASHKRAAALTEIQQLKTEGGLGADPRQEGSNSVRGTVSLCGITLGLKTEFMDQLRSGEAGDFVHFFLCLVKSAGQVIPTTMVATADGLEGGNLHFPNLINFRDLGKDFTIHLEVYGLQTRKEVLPHEAKYHISGTPRASTFLSQLTPKMKFSRAESRLARPAVSSPGGPDTVRTSSFAMVGQAVITISSLSQTTWRLSSVPPISPLDGSMHFSLNGHSESQVTNRGFLTMFDDVSGFGAWHRRWLVLEGNSLSYWKYPENESKQDPIGRIDLAQSVTAVVTIAPRDVCSRMHTFMLETDRPASRDDRESLVIVRSSKERTTIRHLLSADSRVERLAWCQVLNQALDNLRAWDTARSRASSISSLDAVSQSSSQSTEIW